MTRTLVSPQLVGRETQVAQLVGALANARNRRAGTVLVAGEAGAGKTRLLREFLAVARDDGATTLFGSGIEVSAGDLPFVPFRTALRHLVQDRSPEQVEELLGTTWQDLHVLLPELTPSPATGDGTAALPHVFEVVASVISALGRDRHVVLAVDDAQWADQSTLQLLHYLNQADQRLPLLLVVAYRGEELPSDPARRKAFEELSRSADDVVAVTPLDGDQISELVRAIGIELSESSMVRLRSRSGGLPFLVEELVTAERDGVTRGIPRRVRDVVRLRLGALSEPAQLVVALVAVAARPMRHRVLQEAAQLSNRVYKTALSEALAANLLVADSSERTYGFRHDVAREIVHEDLLTASRLELHVRLAVALQSDLPVNAYASRLCEVAHHWLQTDANEEHALRAALLAARASTVAFAHPEALRQYDHVIKLWARVPDAEVIAGSDFVTVSADAAEAGHWAGDTQEALRHIDRALAAAGRLDTIVAAALLERRSHYSWLESGHLERGPDALDRIASAATRERMRASDLMQSGRYAESVAVARSALDLARAVDATSDAIRARIILGVGLSFTGRPIDGIAAIDEALREATDHGGAEELVAARTNLSFALIEDGQMERAAEVAIAGIDEAISRGAGASDGALLAVNAAEALIRVGKLADADRIVREGLERRPPATPAAYLVLVGAEVMLLMGRLTDVAAALTSIADSGPPDDFQFQQQLRAVEAELRLWDPANHSPSTPDVRTLLGSNVAAGVGQQDPPLTARLLWLGVRANADARAVAEIVDRPHRLHDLITDGADLRDRAEALAASNISDGERRQVRAFLALIVGELTRLNGSLDADCWTRAAAAAESDPYLHAYALWRLGSSLRESRRRREAATTLREAYRVAERAGIRVVADAVVSAGNALGVRVDEVMRQSASRKPDLPYHLTAKEMEVLRLLVQGQTNRRIASALKMSEKTASVHVSHILTKLAVGSRGEAVARAYEVGLARPAVNRGG